jgi:hypothetical protein
LTPVRSFRPTGQAGFLGYFILGFPDESQEIGIAFGEYMKIKFQKNHDDPVNPVWLSRR